MADFSSYLGVKVDTIEAPTAAPNGHYYATFQSWKTAERNYAKASGGPPTPVVELTFKITGADDEVMEEHPEAASKAVNKLVTKDYTLNEEGGLYNLRKFTGDTCGVDTKGLSLEDALNACKGSDVKVYNEPRAGKDEGQFYNNVTKVLPV